MKSQPNSEMKSKPSVFSTASSPGLGRASVGPMNRRRTSPAHFGEPLSSTGNCGGSPTERKTTSSTPLHIGSKFSGLPRLTEQDIWQQKLLLPKPHEERYPDGPAPSTWKSWALYLIAVGLCVAAFRTVVS